MGNTGPSPATPPMPAAPATAGWKSSCSPRNTTRPSGTPGRAWSSLHARVTVFRQNAVDAPPPSGIDGRLLPHNTDDHIPRQGQIEIILKTRWFRTEVDITRLPLVVLVRLDHCPALFFWVGL